MNLAVQTFGYALKQSRRRARVILQQTLGPIFVALTITVILVSSGQVFQNALVQVSQDNAYDMNVQYQSVLDSTEVQARTEMISAIQGIQHTESVGFFITSMQENSYLGVIALQEDSVLWSKFTLQQGATSLGANRCYIVLDTRDTTQFSIDSRIDFLIPYFNGTSTIVPFVNVSLQVEGQVSTDLDQPSIFSGQASGEGLIHLPSPTAIAIVKYDSTFLPILDFLSNNAQSVSPSLQVCTSIWLDSEIVASKIIADDISNYISSMKSRISVALSLYGSFAIGSNLESRISELRAYYTSASTDLITSTIPMLIIALIVSNLQGNRIELLKRRESALLRTKGYSTSYVSRVQIWQAVFSGVLASFVGILLGFLFSWGVLGFSNTSISIPQTLLPELLFVIMTVTICVSLISAIKGREVLYEYSIMDLLSVSSLDQSMETNSRKLAVVCLALGSLKMLMWIVHFDPMEFTVLNGGFGNTFIQAIFSIWIVLDSVLNVLGPLLLLYGLASIGATSEIILFSLSGISAKLKGTIGVLASRNLHRNLRRNAQLAMLLAIVVGYATWTAVNVDVQMQYIKEQSLSGNGADVSCYLRNMSDTSFIANIMNIPGVQYVTLEKHFQLRTVSNTIDIVAISPESWESAAYYSANSFRFADSTFNLSVLNDNKSIILEHLVAFNLGLEIGDSITLFHEDTSWTLRIVGFFGPIPNLVTSSDGSSFEYMAQRTWSYVGIGISEELESVVGMQGKLLLKLESQVISSDVVKEIELQNFPIYHIRSFEEFSSLETSLSRTFLELHLVGVFFSTFIAIFGIWALMTSIRYQRREEVRSMRMRGIERVKITQLLFWEIVPLIPFMFIGILVGLISAFGSSIGFQGVATLLVTPHFALGIYSLVMIPPILVAVLIALRVSCRVGDRRIMGT